MCSFEETWNTKYVQSYLPVTNAENYDCIRIAFKQIDRMKNCSEEVILLQLKCFIQTLLVSTFVTILSLSNGWLQHTNLVDIISHSVFIILYLCLVYSF